ncbi:RNA polymerase sigma factor SigD [Ligilactobacillus salitolerans]|uniref:RNA polymerase sigma factor SigD n=1 Tax=Ligilactobacillus salitolerans TaxID=1808352 RepID=A0A401ITU5_9LACO|nr:FliA/WhiG family RNA polymerase sigma factor [Ligilactobacillus salitolerans]GBG94917.1 RNA polymerase sigma factor SigD [Ligilactobacillus salitolerans]
MYELDMEKQVLKYLPLVEKVVARITVKSSDYEYEDLFNTGVIGLMDALKKYDPRKKVPFESYAYVRIRGTVIDEIRSHGRLSRYKFDNLNHYYAAKQELEQQLKREATDDEICQKLGINQKKLNDIYDSLHYMASISLEDVLFSSEQSMSTQDILRDKKTGGDAESALLKQETVTELTAAISKLTEREQLVLSLYYEQELTLKEIGLVLDVSIARVSQIHGRVIAKLRGYMEAQDDSRN